jgi:DNA-directed RNA polymerase subunit RPC12/RpoP
MSNKAYYPDRRPGERSCLKCGKKFKSVDVTANRICNNCSDSNSKERTPKVFKFIGDGSE